MITETKRHGKAGLSTIQDFGLQSLYSQSNPSKKRKKIRERHSTWHAKDPCYVNLYKSVATGGEIADKYKKGRVSRDWHQLINTRALHVREFANAFVRSSVRLGRERPFAFAFDRSRKSGKKNPQKNEKCLKLPKTSKKPKFFVRRIKHV